MELDEIKIIYEDNCLMVVDKPAGLVVHNPPGRHDLSVVDFIFRHIPNIATLKWPDMVRPGIVHRLDKDTSGLLVIAKTPEILVELQSQFQNHLVRKEYIALVYGDIKPEQGTITAEIARHASKDKQTAVPEDINEDTLEKIAKGKIRSAQTDYETIKHFSYKKQLLTLVLAKPKTGRMHQIRIHLKHLGYPIIGDQLYSFKPSHRISKELGISRQFLHATKLTFKHPYTSKTLNLESPLPPELQNIIDKLIKY
ncbi:MAG: RluA family pseudouridine synthase [bacterium]|nr:RluA family pseudouridine synthase [bacterium]